MRHTSCRRQNHVLDGYGAAVGDSSRLRFDNVGRHQGRPKRSNRPTWSPVKGSFARGFHHPLSYCCPTTIFLLGWTAPTASSVLGCECLQSQPKGAVQMTIIRMGLDTSKLREPVAVARPQLPASLPLVPFQCFRAFATARLRARSWVESDRRRSLRFPRSTAPCTRARLSLDPENPGYLEVSPAWVRSN